MDFSTPKSYWIDSTPKTEYPALDKDVQFDVAIVGGGLTGITTALLLKKEGLKVAVIDADRIGKATSGHTTAKITSQHDLIYDQIIREFGEEKARQYADANEYAIKFITENIKKYNIDCDFTTLPAYLFTQDENYIKQLENETLAAQKLGIKAKYLDSLELPFKTLGAMCFENQAQFHPRKYLLSLAKEFVDQDNSIFENTRVMTVESDNPCTIVTFNGHRITADKVILASHFPFYDGMGLYYARLKPERSYLTGVLAKEKLPEGMYLNAEQPSKTLRSQRYRDKEMLIIGGENHKTAHGENTENHLKKIFKFANDYFKVEECLYSWSAQDYTTLDNLPYVGLLTSSFKNTYVATGYRKWGMTNSAAAALILKDLILKGESPWQDVYNPSRSNLSSTATKSFLVENLDVAKELIKGKFEMRQHEFDLENEEGKVVEIEGRKCGAYKDKEGRVHLVDTTCTHMGCELKWNAAEKSWDCPCHGSRFSYEGAILEGPAVRPLNYYKDEPNQIDPKFI